MVVLDDCKENFIVEPENEESSREERRRTGRYLASGIAIFLLVLGFYHAVVYGTTKYAALMGAALIMFLYLLWLLYASHRKKKTFKENGTTSDTPTTLTEVTTSSIKANENSGNEQSAKTEKLNSGIHTFKRTYSIA